MGDHLEDNVLQLSVKSEQGYKSFFKKLTGKTPMQLVMAAATYCPSANLHVTYFTMFQNATVPDIVQWLRLMHDNVAIRTSIAVKEVLDDAALTD